jgi:hypothetical protein
MSIGAGFVLFAPLSLAAQLLAKRRVTRLLVPTVIGISLIFLAQVPATIRACVAGFGLKDMYRVLLSFLVVMLQFLYSVVADRDVRPSSRVVAAA